MFISIILYNKKKIRSRKIPIVILLQTSFP